MAKLPEAERKDWQKLRNVFDATQAGGWPEIESRSSGFFERVLKSWAAANFSTVANLGRIDPYDMPGNPPDRIQPPRLS